MKKIRLPEGECDAPQNFINTVKRMVDDMHSWYHDKNKLGLPEQDRDFYGLHFHGAVLLIDKASAQRPTHSRVQK